MELVTLPIHVEVPKNTLGLSTELDSRSLKIINLTNTSVTDKLSFLKSHTSALAESDLSYFQNHSTHNIVSKESLLSGTD